MARFTALMTEFYMVFNTRKSKVQGRSQRRKEKRVRRVDTDMRWEMKNVKAVRNGREWTEKRKRNLGTGDWTLILWRRTQNKLLC